MSLFTPLAYSANTGPSLSVDHATNRRFVPPEPNTRENWRKTSSVAVDVFYAYKDRKVAQSLLVHANKRIPEISRNLGVGAGEAMQVYIAPTQAVFAKVQPGAPPDWADGVAPGFLV